MILVLVRAWALACRGHHELVLENLALRQQHNALRLMTRQYNPSALTSSAPNAAVSAQNECGSYFGEGHRDLRVRRSRHQ